MAAIDRDSDRREAAAGAGLRLEHRPLESLIPYARNARTHSEDQVARIAGSIREFGFTCPLLIDGTNGVIAGHGRLLAARKLGMTSVPVIELAHLSEAQKRAYGIADNQLAVAADWDLAMLRMELADLRAEGFDLELTGFDMGELAGLLVEPGAGLTDPDETPGVPDEPVSRLGDVLRLGRHRLVCGDSTDAEVVAKALNGVAPNLMVTDPPYGVSYDPAWRNKAGAAQTRRTGKVENDDRADWREAWALFPGDVAYVWHGALDAAAVAESLEAAGFAIRSQIIWAKERLVLSRGATTGSTNPAGTRSARARRAAGRATASRPRCGASRAATRTRPPCMARRSPALCIKRTKPRSGVCADE